MAGSWYYLRQGHLWDKPLFLPGLVPTPWGSLLCTHCPPAGGWTAGLGEDDHGPGCHSGSGSRSGHSVEPVGSQRAEVRAIPKMGVQDSTALTSGPDFLVFRFLTPRVTSEPLKSPRRQAGL